MRALTSDHDHFFTSDALAPDPIYMGLRALVSASPLGALGRALEARNDRRNQVGSNPAQIVTFPAPAAPGRTDRAA